MYCKMGGTMTFTNFKKEYAVASTYKLVVESVMHNEENYQKVTWIGLST